MKNRYSIILPAILLMAVMSISFLNTNDRTDITTVATTSVEQVNHNYVSNKSPLEPLHFIKLPIKSIEPQGWIRKYLELQRDGLTGHLGEISAWLDKNGNAWFSGNGKGNHGWEEVPYWLKGYGDLGYLLHDTTIINETKQWLEKVFQSQRPDGYFGPAIVEKEHQNNKGKTPDLWPRRWDYLPLKARNY